MSLGKDKWEASKRHNKVTFMLVNSLQLKPWTLPQQKHQNEKLLVTECLLYARPSVMRALDLHLWFLLIPSTTQGCDVCILSGNTLKPREHTPHHFVREGARTQRLIVIRSTFWTLHLTGTVLSTWTNSFNLHNNSVRYVLLLLLTNNEEMEMPWS